MVLVDSSHPNQEGEVSKVVSAEISTAKAAYFQNETPPETWFSPALFAQGETPYTKPGSLGEMPITVLTADSTLPNEDEIERTKKEIWSGYDIDIARAEKKVFRALQEQHARLSSNAQPTEVERSSHCIQNDKPEVVPEAVQQVVAAVRTGEPLAKSTG